VAHRQRPLPARVHHFLEESLNLTSSSATYRL
jgi:hypothetical protein